MGAVGALKALAMAAMVFPLPFFLFQGPALLPFALEIEISPTNTASIDFVGHRLELDQHIS